MLVLRLDQSSISILCDQASFIGRIYSLEIDLEESFDLTFDLNKASLALQRITVIPAETRPNSQRYVKIFHPKFLYSHPEF